jgi:membrane fusion protein
LWNFFDKLMFRPEVISTKKNRLSGEVSIAIPISWQSIGYLIFFGVITTGIFLGTASYSRVETVSGTITPDTGVSTVFPTRVGVVSNIVIRDGQRVNAGDELVSIRSEEDGASDLSPSALVETAIAKQDASVAAQIAAAQSNAKAQTSQLAAQRQGLIGELNQLRLQVGSQRALIDSAQKDLDRARLIADRGFISRRDLQVREETLLARQQGLAQLEQNIAVKQSSLVENQSSVAQIAAQDRAQTASLDASRAEVAKQAATAAGSRSYVIRAPISGQVTALIGRKGQVANPQTPLMTIVPNGAKLQAELAVPSAAIGFIKPGQKVRLAIDAFPYQRFGTVTGKIQTVAASAVKAQEADGSAISVYPVTVMLDDTKIDAFGRQEPLISGMTLTARIITEKQSLFYWLFEPLFAVRER